jgi:uncharacterized repeat protein (TIGR03803 family)
MKPRHFLPVALAFCGFLPAFASTFETLYTIPSGPSVPYSPLLRGVDGNFYGSSGYGGDRNVGTIYRVTPSGAISVVISFTGQSGAVPGARPTHLIQDAAGTLYGTTFEGGPGNTIGGTVFKVTPQGQHTLLRSFDGHNASQLGYYPTGPLALDAAGNLYGCLRDGGAWQQGAIFKIDPNGAFTILLHFTGTDGPGRGRNPAGGLIPDGAGGFLGTTTGGGENSFGTVFRILPDGTHTVLADFAGVSAQFTGAYPDAPLTPDGAGNFYGVSKGFDYQSPSVFRINANGTFTFVAAIGSAVGQYPTGGLVREADGNFLGVLGGGPQVPGDGTHQRGCIYRVTPAGVVTIAVDPDLSPSAPIVGLFPQTLTPDGAGGYVGVMQGGGSGGSGTLFRIDAGGQFTHVSGILSGPPAWPHGSLVSDAAGNLYGTSSGGGAKGEGTVFRYTPGGVFTVLAEFTGLTGAVKGSVPYPELAIDPAGNLFGTTFFGGGANGGTVFKITPAGAFSTLKEFTDIDHPDGATPQGVILDAAGNLFGAANRENDDEEGVVYQIAPSGDFSILGGTGAPYDHYAFFRLARDPLGNLFGISRPDDSENDASFLYRITPAGVVTTLKSYRGGDYSDFPVSPFTATAGGAFHAVLLHGAIGRISASGAYSEPAKLLPALHGSSFQGELMADETGNLFGVTTNEGPNGQGALFRVSPRGLVTTLHAFGGFPITSFRATGIMRHADGALYGTASSWGGGNGILYRIRSGPTPTTQEAVAVSGGNATLRAKVNPHGESTVVVFEYGPTPALGSETAPVNLGSGTAFVDVAVQVTGLAPNVAAYFRPRAASATGTQYGDVLNTISNVPFGEWRISYFGNTAFTEFDDPDHDGVPLLTEYAFHLSPVASDAHLLPHAVKMNIPGGRLGITFTRDPSRTDITLIVESATDFLGPWTSIATSAEGQPFTGPAAIFNDDSSTSVHPVTVCDPAPLDVSTHRFLRVRVTH